MGGGEWEGAIETVQPWLGDSSRARNGRWRCPEMEMYGDGNARRWKCGDGNVGGDVEMLRGGLRKEPSLVQNGTGYAKRGR